MVHKLLAFSIFLGGVCTGLGVVAAEPAADAMPPAANAILSQMDKEISIAKTKALVALEKVLKDTTKKGDLAGALAVKKTIEQLQTETQGRGGGAVTNRVNGNAIVGRWMQGGTIITEFFADGSVKQGGLTGQWATDGSVVEVQWSNKRTYRLNADADGLIGVQLEATGHESAQIRLTRAK